MKIPASTQSHALLEDNITRADITYRGGGVELNLAAFGYEDELLSAYQNYLGGGLRSAVANSCTIQDWQKDKTLTELATQLRAYYGELRQDFDHGDDYDEYIQNRPVSYPGL